MGLFGSSEPSKPERKLWETISGTTGHGVQRCKVPTGWLVIARGVESIALEFVPDPEHKWNLEEKS